MLHREEKSPFFDEAYSSVPFSPFLVLANNFAKGRVEGFSLGTSEYVSYCDDDDLVLLNKEQLVDLVDTKAPAMYTNSYIKYESTGKMVPFGTNKVWDWESQRSGKLYVHQLVIVRRDIAQEAAEFAMKIISAHGIDYQVAFDMIFNLRVGKTCGWVYHDVMGYVWRKWNPEIQIHPRIPEFVETIRRKMK
jgi:hypothetical protein